MRGGVLGTPGRQGAELLNALLAAVAALLGRLGIGEIIHNSITSASGGERACSAFARIARITR